MSAYDGSHVPRRNRFPHVSQTNGLSSFRLLCADDVSDSDPSTCGPGDSDFIRRYFVLFGTK